MRVASPFPAPERYTPQHLARRILGSREAIEGERKHITVLFADIRGSLEMLGDRDPEEMRARLDPILTQMMDAVHHYEGTVNQVLGDGIMALFGAPLAHEDHAVRACYAALEMHEAMARHAETLSRGAGMDLKIRIGLNSGEVVVRSIGSDLQMDYTAVGQTTHLASRMEQLARPGTTYLASATRRLVEGFVETRPLGPVPVKGLTAPVEVFELTGVGPARTRLQVARTKALTPFVGRAGELADLARAATSAQAGHGQVVAVVGEPGVGKSRLVSEFIGKHLGVGWRVVEAGTVFYGRSAGSPAAVDLVRGYFGLGNDDGPERIRDKIAGGLEALGALTPSTRDALAAVLSIPVDDPAWQTLDPSQRRQQTMDAISGVLLRHSRTEPVCLVVDDLHWADAETQALLDRLVDRLPTARMLLIATYRPEYEHGWSGWSYYTQFPIEPLPRDETEHLLADLLGASPDLLPVKRLLIERTEGNPFFLEECVRDLVEKGVLLGERGAYRKAGAASRFDVPPTIQSVLAARIDRLPLAERQLLQSAAVIGKDVPLALLEATAEPTVTNLAGSLRQLQDAELIYDVGLPTSLEYTFKHVLTHEVAYGTLIAERRRVIDGRVVTTLEGLYPEPTAEQIERLAHHAFRGEQWDRAVRYCREAGVRAFARSAHRVAVHYFDRALVALGHLPRTVATAELAIDLRLDLRYALMPLGEFPRVGEHLSEAGNLARETGDQRRLGLVSAFLTNYYHLMGDVDRAIESGREALAIAERIHDRQTEILANAALGLTYYVVGDYPQAIAVARRNVALLQGPLVREHFGSAPLPSVYSRTCLAWSLAELGEFAEGAAVAREGLEIAEAADHSVSLVYACLGLGGLALRQGRLETAVPTLERAFALCHDADIPMFASMIAPSLTSAYVLAGRAKDALEMLERAGRQAASIGDPVDRRTGPGALSEAYLASGRVADALPLARSYLDQRRSLKARGFEGWALRLLGDVLAQQDPPAYEEAGACYAEALAIARGLRMRPLEALCHLALGGVHQRLGRSDVAEQEISTATAMLHQLGMALWSDRLPREDR
jgi:class 3 adenylate cyclase/tetratricopeptide (TPR) repeat protein